MTQVNTDYPAVIVFGVTKILTDAQIKALPTTPVQILAPQGANKIAWVIGAFVNFKPVSPYSNFDFSVSLKVGPPSPADIWQNCSNADLILGSSVAFDKQMGTNVGQGSANSDVVNKATEIRADNGGSGNFTGGNAGNSLAVTILYTVIDA